MLHVRWVEEQRFWSRVDTGIKDILVGTAKIRTFNYLVILAKMVALYKSNYLCLFTNCLEMDETNCMVSE